MLGREFYRVGEQIQKHLPQANTVIEKVFVGNVVDLNLKVLAAFGRLRTNNAVDLPYLLGKADIFGIQRDFGGFDFAHIQNIVDKAE